jgi:hypothetical protein
MLSFCWLKITANQDKYLIIKTLLEEKESMAHIDISIVYEIPLFIENLSMEVSPKTNQNTNVDKYVFIMIKNSIQIFNEYGILKTVDTNFLIEGFSVLQSDQNSCRMLISIDGRGYLCYYINLIYAINKQFNDLNNQQRDIRNDKKDEYVILSVKPFHDDVISNSITHLPHCEDMIILSYINMTASDNSVTMIGIHSDYGIQLFKGRNIENSIIHENNKLIIPSIEQTVYGEHCPINCAPFKCSSRSMIDSIGGIKKSLIIRSKDVLMCLQVCVCIFKYK